MKIPLPTSLRQLALLIRETVTLRQVFLNRITLVLMATLLIAGGAQAYTNANDDGQISGTVVGPDGEPVPNANVTIRPIGSETVGSSQTTNTDDEGKFVFTNQTRVLEFEITATKGGQTEVRRIHLYFRGQNTDVTLKLGEKSG